VAFAASFIKRKKERQKKKEEIHCAANDEHVTATVPFAA
jgi:hypothetical protein